MHTACFIALGLFPAIAAAQPIDKLWAERCADCHGPKAEGVAGKAKSLINEKWYDTKSDRQLYLAVRDGTAFSPETTLKDHAFGTGGGGDKPTGDSKALTDAQCWSMVVYLREQSARAKPDKAPTPDHGVIKLKSGGSFSIETVVEKGLKTPWSIEWLDRDTAVIAERGGTMKLLRNGALTDILGLPISVEQSQGGLMDIAIHPTRDATKGPWVYIGLTAPLNDEEAAKNAKARTMTTIYRGHITFRDSGNRAPIFDDRETIFRAKDEHFLTSGVHFGTRIVFSPKKAKDRDNYYVFFSIGERGQQEHAQDLTRPNGKVHRLYDDGLVPDDNPFTDATKHKNAYTSIWSYGHRNPQGLTFDNTGRLWDTEHAPRGGDELNLIEKGRNYGWPRASFGIEYSGQPKADPWSGGGNFVMPAFYWLPSIAACGLDADPSRNDKQLQHLYAGGLAGACVDRLSINPDTNLALTRERILANTGRVRDVRFGPDGNLYVVLNQPDKIIRLRRP